MNSLVAGERVIEPHVIDIVKMLLPPTDGPPLPRSQLEAPAAALYDLCRNGKSGAVLL